MADMEDYLTIEAIIRKIDIPRAMVYIEALIMEVSVDKDFRLGTEWLIGGQTIYEDREMIYGGGFSGGATGGDAGYAAVGSTTNPITGEAVTLLPPGFSLGLFGEALEISGVTFPSIAAIIQAYKKDRDVRILSTPQILTTDNQEAKIYVGQNVPFQTQTSASTTGTQLYNSYEYRDVGKSLKITPQISKDRMVRLEMALEVTDLQSAADNRPTTLKRTVETTAIVKDGHTVVLGGLIDDKAGLTEYRVPCLGSIPVLGMLFRSQAKSNNQSNLYVFLTPRVIQNPDEATEVSITKRKEIDNLQEGLIKLYDRDSTGKNDTRSPASAPANASDSEQKQPLREDESQSEANPPTSERPSQDEAIAVGPPAPDGVISQAAQTKADNAPASGAAADQSPRNAPETPVPEPVAKQSQAARGIDDTENTSAEASVRRDKAVIGSAGFTIQVASIKDAKTAQELVTKLNAMNYAAYMVRSLAQGQVWHRVRIGFFNTRAEAAETLKALRKHKYAPILIQL
jgi:general secretion pathway protein D